MKDNSKRAIVYVCWGQKFINEALASARTTDFLGIDRILITTEESLVFLPASHPFARVVAHAFALPGLLCKTEMAALLPGVYDSFLFLDTDTRVLLDVTFGFEKAEAHGIAAVMAPHYSLEHFWGFGRMLDQVGHPHVDTLQYNTGVLFFSRRPDAWKVLEGWHRMCAELGGGPFDNDQPFLTLAMERQGFNPYTLSPAYNYRNMGGQISGLIRIWHSHLPPPPDVNVFTEPWPPRSFKDNVRTEHR
jgi:hypothetical protein